MLRRALRLPLVGGALAAALSTLTQPERLHAQSGADERVSAEECCLPLLLHVGARAVGLGNALTARPGADALFVNPAALGWLTRDEFRVHSSETDIETSTAFSLAFRIGRAGTIAATYRLVDYGEVEATGEFGEPIGTLRLLHHALMGSFGTILTPGVAAGISYKLYQFRQDCRGSCTGFAATTHAVDAGVQYHPPLWRALQLGASVVHLGTALQVINAEQEDPTPVRIRAGGAYELMHHFTSDSTTALWASLDVSGSWREGVAPVIGSGLELTLDETIYVRGGYTTGSGRNAGGAVGVGLRYDRFDIGIAKTFVSSTTGQDPYHITFAVGF
jgi:hypothetical protein